MEIWKGMRNLISMTKFSASVPNTLSQNDESITDPIKIENIFNNFFSIYHSSKYLLIKYKIFKITFFMKTKNLGTFFIYPATKEEISNIIPYLNPNKTTGPFSIPMKILKLFKKG